MPEEALGFPLPITDEDTHVIVVGSTVHLSSGTTCRFVLVIVLSRTVTDVNTLDKLATVDSEAGRTFTGVVTSL